MLLKSFKKFGGDESGAITVDWVVLTAALAGIAFAVLMVIAPGMRVKANAAEPSLVAAPGLGASLISGDTDS